MQTQHAQDLFNKIRMLPPEKVSVVEDFIEFLRQRDESDGMVRAVGRLSERSFEKVWDNPEDAEYDDL